MSAIRCTVVQTRFAQNFYAGDPRRFTVDVSSEEVDVATATLVLVLFPNGRVLDHRIRLRFQPPFLQILPCPWCGVAEDRNHNVLKHVNTHIRTELAR